MKTNGEDKNGLVAGNVYVLTPKPKSAEKREGLRAFRYDSTLGFVPVACVKVGGRTHWLSESSLARLS